MCTDVREVSVFSHNSQKEREYAYFPERQTICHNEKCEDSFEEMSQGSEHCYCSVAAGQHAVTGELNKSELGNNISTTFVHN